MAKKQISILPENTSVSKISRAIYITHSQEIADHIVDLYASGESLASIARMSGMPSYQSIMQWVRRVDKFREDLQAVKETRALHYEEKAIEVATASMGKDDVPAARLAFDALRWGAEVNAPHVYGKKTTIQGDFKNPIQIVVSTGVPQPLPHQQATELTEVGILKDIVIEQPVIDG